MRVAVSGSSGLIGTALCAALEGAGHEVVRLVRRAPANAGETQWDIASRTVDEGALQDVGAIVNLAGENIGQRWTATTRRRAWESRVDGTLLLAETAARLPGRPVVACASAVGYYGYESADLVDESAPRGSGFLAELVEAWEAAADPARTAGLRTVHLRQGLVLSSHGGALERMLLPFKLGGGGRIGSGRQWWSWVSLADAVSAYLYALDNPLEGPVNVAAPGAVTNEEFTKELGRVLHRPTVLPVPTFALKALFGEMAEEMLLGGQRVSPGRLEAAGFTFANPELRAALEAALAD
jgi:uncharacterized protein (TIGR01777 family)